MSARDWSGGLDPGLDGDMLPGAPDDPEMRESASVWIFEENGEFALPRIGIEAVGDAWDAHRYDCNIAFKGGRILRQSARGPTQSTLDGDGRHRVLGAGGLQFRCIEPFRKWAVSFEDTVYESTVEEQIRGNFRVYCDSEIDPSLKRTPLKWNIELENATPGWTQDFRPDKLGGLSEGDLIDAGLMGYGWRVEHTFRGEGELTIDGETRSFRCVGNRIHRQGVRPMGAFRGHCWQAAVFPDGRAFGLCTYPPREDGTTYNQAYVYQDGKMHFGRALNPAFLRRIMPEGDDAAVEIETDLGVTRIEGATTLSTFHIGNPGVNGMNNQQGTVRYSLDGMTTYGMIERSSPAELCEIIL
jgi:hypothetical protein